LNAHTGLSLARFVARMARSEIWGGLQRGIRIALPSGLRALLSLIRSRSWPDVSHRETRQPR
jgi:hypothetical protein